uniref:membrane-spanning 4-domains subfamily A member 5-like isoform X1 n=2 Tax=Pristiophorus japonicus TaxID=55135 RepID=UPI00398F28CF
MTVELLAFAIITLPKLSVNSGFSPPADKSGSPELRNKMAVSFNKNEFIVTTCPVAHAGSMYPAPCVPNSQLQQVPRYIQRFRKGEQKALGVVQIMLGIIQVTFGVPFGYANAVIRFTGIPWWTGLLYIISGALSVSLEKNLTKSLLIGGLVMNILSTIAAGIGVIVFTIVLLMVDRNSINLETSQAFVSCILVFTIFEFIISIATSVFNCCGLQCCELDEELNSFAIQSAAAQNNLAQEPMVANYETLLADRSDYQTLYFK